MPAEQIQIARFLDHQTARIDALIAEQQRLIELLKEKRQAVISHAVTKGLDPDVAMKDSGVEWLGEVPEHWQVLPLRRLSKRVETGGTPLNYKPSEDFDTGTPWFTPGDFNETFGINSAAKKLPKEAIANGEAKTFPAHSVFIVGIGATLGKVALCEVECSANQQINVIVPKDTVQSHFLTYALYAKNDVMRLISNASTIGIMNQEKTKELYLAVPPKKEQEEIARFIHKDSDHILQLINQAEKSAILLRERRSALISAVVTGKIDVRDWQPPSSETFPESSVSEGATA